MNPFTLKELRQLTRSRTIASSLVLFLFAAVVMVYLFPLSGISFDTGLGIFAAIVTALAVMFNLVLPVDVFIRMQKERGGKQTSDLTLVTPLPPSAIIDGKLRSAYALMFLFSAASLPFGVAAYLLHGITFVQMLQLLALLIAASSMSVHITIAISAMRITPSARRVLFAVFMIVNVYSVIGGTVALNFAGDALLDEFWVPLAVMTTVCLMLRAYAVALISPKVMDRDSGIRYTTLAAIVGWFAYVIIRYYSEGIRCFFSTMQGITYMSLIAVGLIAVRAVSQDAGYSVRQIAALPSAGWKKVLRWPFASGMVNGFVFAAVVAVLVSSVLPMMADYISGQYVIQEVRPCDGNPDRVFAQCFCPMIEALYLLALLMYVRAVWYTVHRFLRIPPVLLPVIAEIIMVIIQTLPPAFELSGVCFPDLPIPFMLKDCERAMAHHLVYSWSAFALGIVLMLPEMLRAFRFKDRI